MSEETANHNNELARLLLAVQRQPGQHAMAQRQPPLLFEHMRVVLQWAAGRQLAAAGQAGCSETELQHAAMWLVRQTCLRAGADPLTVMGLASGFTRERLRDHYRLLIRLTHPDFMAGHEGEAPWPADAAQRINTANDALLRRLGDADIDPGEPEPPPPQTVHAPQPPAWPQTPARPPRPAAARAKAAPDDGESLWSRMPTSAKMAGAAGGALLCVVALLWSNGGTQRTHLVARPALPPATPPAAAQTGPAQAPEEAEVAAASSGLAVVESGRSFLPSLASLLPAPAPAPEPEPASAPAPAVVTPRTTPADMPRPQPARTAAAAPAREVVPQARPRTEPEWWESTPSQAPQLTPASSLVTTVAPAPQAVAEPPPHPPPPPPAPPPPPPTRLTMVDVQLQMTHLLGHLGQGRAREIAAMVSRGRAGQEFQQRFQDWLGTSRVNGLGAVSMQARPSNGQLWVDGTAELHLSTAEGQSDRRVLPFRAMFDGEPGAAALVGMTLRQP